MHEVLKVFINGDGGVKYTGMAVQQNTQTIVGIPYRLHTLHLS